MSRVTASGLVDAVDHYLLFVSTPVRAIVVLLTLISMAVTVLPRLGQYGTDTIADMYESKVILNDVGDMYTKQQVEQTPLEAGTWTKEASSPYPPAALLALAGLFATGSALGIGLSGMVSLLAFVFLAWSLVCFWRTRWYLFPLLYLNFSYFGERFFYVQDGSYLVMLSTVMAAMMAARRFPAVSHLLMAVAITMKVSPLYYARHIRAMSRPVAAAFVAIVLLGLVAPYFIWDNYLYIYRYNSELKGDTVAAIGALAVAVPFAILLWRVETRRGYDLEELIGWSLVPVALFFAFKMNVARHLLLVLLIPDKRGLRNVAVGVAMAAHYAWPSVVRVNSALPIAAAILLVGLIVQLKRSSVRP